MTGTFVDHCERDKINRLGRWYKPWFYTVRGTLKTKNIL